ncbi:aftiphilin isoform X1 [Xiphophorus couchianus]|uniref:aftiphilin isoform X1 n=1 Tax=Xiphophorus couchianus TaxID=32473 RepID=UPI001016F43C|nr:aftiphilin isoform X1 [Xiphophorus couchianus]XP_027863756.1 aftiphilin isoform X1 [Xiphophorus couchianus]
MEPDVMPPPSYSPPPLDDDGDDGVESEEDEFGDFSIGGVCSPLGHADFTESATHQSDGHLVEQTQRTPSEETGSRDPESSLHYSNGRAGEDLQPGAQGSSVEDTGFADFAMFTEQAGHPWCCGFTEQWDGRVDERECVSGQEVVMESEPRSQHACKTNGGICVEGEHCEKRDAALVHPPQDHSQPQGDEGNVCLRSAEEGQNVGKPLDLFVAEPASDRVSCHDNWSSEEPNVSSLTSQCGQSDWDQTDDEVEDCGYSDAVVSGAAENLGPSELNAPHCDATQETSATSCPEKHTYFANANALRHREPVETADTGAESLGNLPPSDSFADFCSAPTQDDEERPTWADFTDQSGLTEGRPSTQRSEPVDEQDGVTRMTSCQDSLSCHVQQLLQSSFPKVCVPAVEGEEDLSNLGALLHIQQPPETEEEIPELSRSLRIQRLMFSLSEDMHCSLGLQFKWGGSHSNTSLLRCLGVDTRNIVFIGTKKQAVTVPAYASSLGMLDPTKDPPPAVCSPGRTAVAAPSGPPETQKPSTSSAQELPSNQPDWSCRGHSSSQEVCSSFNLDYFGSEDESRSSSRASSPPPGVDRELYKLIISKLEADNKTSQIEDTLNRLMSAAESTSISARKPSAQEELSGEAGRMISELPDLSFMQAKVLMFPVFLTPEAHSSPKLL